MLNFLYNYYINDVIEHQKYNIGYKRRTNPMALKPNSLLVFNYVKENDGKDFTAADIAEATGLSAKQVNGIITSAFQKKGLMIREEVAVTGGKVKYIRFTDEGRDFDPTADDEQ